MPKPAGSALVPATPQQIVRVTGDLGTSIQSFDGPLAAFLGGLGLATEEVLVEYKERLFVLQSLQKAPDVLPYKEREKGFLLVGG